MSTRSLRTLAAVILLAWSAVASPQLMTVRNLEELIAQGPGGEAVAVGYVQGVIDGMLGMDSLYQKEKRLPPEFCRFFDSYKKGKPERHPAYRTKELVATWKREGAPMDTIAVDMVLAHLSAQYTCKR